MTSKTSNEQSFAEQLPQQAQLLADVAHFHPQASLEPLHHALSQLSVWVDEQELALARASMLAHFRADIATVCAGLLLQSPASAREDKVLGADIWQLVDAATRLSSIAWDKLGSESPENLRRMFVAMAADARVLLITLSDRACVIKSLDSYDADARKQFARETLDVFAPLANRMGIWQLKWQLEDLSLRALEPVMYRELKFLLAETRTQRDQYVHDVISQLQSLLAHEHIHGTLSGRPKHIYSIYKKMQRKHVGFDEIYDVIAVRVLVEKVSECYAVLGLVHGQWAPIPGEFDDYIARPKNNYYRSLHTAVHGPNGKSLEVQIRTHEMHEFAEFGVAAHWAYKEGGRGSRSDRDAEAQFDLLHEILDLQKHAQDPEMFAQGLKTELFREQVYVFTPKGEVIGLPRGATPLDFAYRVHTSVGHRCKGARVNGKLVPLQTTLETGDRIEILTRKQDDPSRDWLSTQSGYLHTSSARQKVRVWFRQQGRDEAISAGRAIYDKATDKLGIKEALDEKLAQELGAKSVEDLLANLGYGDMTPHRLTTLLLEREQKLAPTPPTIAPPSPRQAKSSSKSAASGVMLGGTSQVMSQPARCCSPLPGDPVIGYISRGRGIVLHRRDCSNITNLSEPERLFDVEWSGDRNEAYPVKLEILARNHPNLLKSFVEIFGQYNVATRSFDTRHLDQDVTRFEIVVEISSANTLSRLLSRLDQANGVSRVTRLPM